MDKLHTNSCVRCGKQFIASFVHDYSESLNGTEQIKCEDCTNNTPTLEEFIKVNHVKN